MSSVAIQLASRTTVIHDSCWKTRRTTPPSFTSNDRINRPHCPPVNNLVLDQSCTCLSKPSGAAGIAYLACITPLLAICWLPKLDVTAAVLNSYQHGCRGSRNGDSAVRRRGSVVPIKLDKSNGSHSLAPTLNTQPVGTKQSWEWYRLGRGVEGDMLGYPVE